MNEGKIVISNRYVSANMGHQAGKIKQKKARDKFLGWLDNLEYKVFQIPRSDLTILLYVPPEIGQKLVDRKMARRYIKGKKRDIHEADLNHLKNSAKSYLYVAKKYHWAVIDCTCDGEILPREIIHKKIWSIVSRFCRQKSLDKIVLMS